MLLNEILNTIDIKEFYYIGESTNVKLYDVSFYCYQNDINYDLFNIFCENEWDFFSGYLKNVGASLEFIGSTSSFYFIPTPLDFNFYYMRDFKRSEPEERCRMLFDEFLYYTGAYDSLEEMIDAGWGVDEIKKEWMQYCANVLTPINEACEYLDLFKLNQVNSFIEFLNDNQDIDIDIDIEIAEAA